MPEVTIQAPAKINLGLEVLRRRNDGFHDINTVFAAVGVFDTITLALRPDREIVMRVEGNRELETGEGNLCVQAARRLRQIAAEELPGLDITLEKRIPMGAGLGGGSSDAAAVLRGAATLWELPADEDEMHRLALGLGSDVPFFLSGAISRASSRGEMLVPLEIDLSGLSILLVNPGIHLPTPWAYKAVGRAGERPASDLAATIRRGLVHPEILRDELVNDFEKGVFAEYPRLAEIKGSLYAAGAIFALMSGSGSTLFGLFRSRKEAQDAAGGFPGCWSAVADFLTSV